VQDLLLGLRRQGLNVWGEIYPYAAGSTTLNAVFFRPEIYVEQLGKRYEDSLFDPITQTFYTQGELRAHGSREEPTRHGYQLQDADRTDTRMAASRGHHHRV
jgi:hypothetical protein